jgi:hypothetical protein
MGQVTVVLDVPAALPAFYNAELSQGTNPAVVHNFVFSFHGVLPSCSGFARPFWPGGKINRRRISEHH